MQILSESRGMRKSKMFLYNPIQKDIVEKKLDLATPLGGIALYHQDVPQLLKYSLFNPSLFYIRFKYLYN